MVPFLYQYKRKIANKKGMTIVEAVVTMAIVTVIMGLLVAGIIRIVNQAYMRRANDTAEVIYMAAQSAITDLKADGTFDEVFADDKRGYGQYHTMPKEAIDGGVIGSTAYPGIKIDETSEQQQKYRDQLKQNEELIYMKLSMDDSCEDSELLRDLLEPYLNDKSILEYSILVEVNLNNKTVRAAFYTERADELVYQEGTSLTEEQLLDKKNVLLRDRYPSLYKKRQGYYGSMGVGEEEDLDILENAYVKVNNDDMLVAEWGEIAPVRDEKGPTEEKRKDYFTKMTYDLKIVNAHDTTRVYYQLEDITAYGKNEDYVTPGTTKIEGDTPGKVRDPMPVYDLYGYSYNDGIGVNNALDEELMVPVKTTVYNEDGSVKEVYDGSTDEKTYLHRLAYYVPEDQIINGELKKQYGVFRLVMDSIDDESDINDEDDISLSIRDRYPEIPWDEDFKVIVEGKYKGEGFTGSLSISEGQDNGYVASKTLNPEEDMYFDGTRGANAIQELINYFNASREAERSNMWYQVEYARHLNNMRYIIGYEDGPGEDKEGYKQNFLLTDDIDWSLQKLNVKENEEEDDAAEKIHELTVSNAVGGDLTKTSAASLRTYQALTAPSNTGGFQGKFLSEAKRDEEGNIVYEVDENDNEILYQVPGASSSYPKQPVPVYENYTLSYLKLANDAWYGSHVGLFSKVGECGYLRDFMVDGATALGNQNVGAVAGEFHGYAKNITVLANETPNYHLEAKLSGDKWEEKQITVNSRVRMVEPSKYTGNGFTGNTIEAKEENGQGGRNAGGIFGSFVIREGSGITTPADRMDGIVRDLANGTRLVNLYDGEIQPNQNQDSLNGNADLSDLNGLAVIAKNNAGGLIGNAGEKTTIIKVVNTGQVTASAANAGGVVGLLEDRATINAWDEDALREEEEILNREYEYVDASNEVKTKEFAAEYTNYGLVKAQNYAGGVVGYVSGVGSSLGNNNETQILNVANAGPVLAEDSYAGGIAAAHDGRKVILTNITNKAEIIAKNYDYAGGVIGSAVNDTVIQGGRNLATQTGNSLLANVLGTSYQTVTKGKSRISAGFENGSNNYSPGSYAGGIVGYGDDTVDIRHYLVPDDLGTVSKDETIVVQNTGAVYGSKDYVGGIAGELVDRATLNVNNPSGNVITIINRGNINAGQSYAGGIVGAAIQSTAIENVRNNGGAVTAGGQYAGGVAGAAAGNVTIHNAENFGGTVTALSSYAGGIIGEMGSEQGTETGSGTTARVSLKNDVALARDGSSISNYYYTNTGAVKAVNGNYAGGIVGYAENSNHTVDNVFNYGKVEAQSNAGGIFGGVSFETELYYDLTLIRGRMSQYGLPTNDGDVVANQTRAGGIAGVIGSEKVKLNNAFNAGDVTATLDFAGGIAGQISEYTTASILSYNYAAGGNDIVKDIVTGTNRFYTNTGDVTARNYAGGIVGSSAVSLLHVFNRGNVKATDSDAGGIVGHFQNDGHQLSVGYYDDVANNVLNTTNMYSNRGRITAKNDNAGGIVGYSNGGSIVIDNAFNYGTIVTESGSSAGGLAGRLAGTSKIQLSAGIARTSIEKSFYTNQGDVTAGNSNAGGIIARSEGDAVITDVFNRGTVRANGGGTNGNNAGGIAGYLEGENEVVLTASVSALSVDKSFYTNRGNVTAGGNQAGGIIGNAAQKTKVLNTHNSGTVTATRYENAGGIIGFLGSTGTVKTEQTSHALTAINNSFYTNNNVVTAGTNNAGGIIGYAEADVEIADVFNSGNVKAGSNQAGGIAGYLRGANEVYLSTSVAQRSVEKSFYTNSGNIAATSGSQAGGIIGYAKEETDIRNMFSGKMANNGTVTAGVDNAGGVVGLLESKGTIKLEETIAQSLINSSDSFYTNSHVVTAGRNNAGGIAGRVADNAEIIDVFNKGNVRANGTSTNGNNAGGIAGVLEGENKVALTTSISNLSVQKKFYTNQGNVLAGGYRAGGIVGYAVKDTKVLNMHNSGTVTVTRYENAGGIVGLFGSTGIIKIELESHARTAVGNEFYTNKDIVKAGTNNAGGILGAAQGKVEIVDVFNSGTVTAGASYAGGIAGYLNGTVEAGEKNQVYLNTSVSRDSVTRAFYTNKGNVTATGGSQAGGIVGYSRDTIDIINVFNSGEVKAAAQNAGGIAGLLDSTGTIKLEETIAKSLLESITPLHTFYTNSNAVTAGTNNSTGNNAGGIVGRAADDVEIADVFSRGTIRVNGTNTNGNNAGGIAGILEGKNKIYLNNAIASLAIEKEFYTNQGTVTAANSYAGGIVGRAEKDTDIINVSNEKDVTATRGSNAGGIAGSFGGAGVLEFQKTVAEEAAEAELQTNRGEVEAGTDNAGGIVGKVTGTIKITDVVNSGNVTAKNDNAGGVAGYLTDSVVIQHKKNIINNIMLPKYYMTNQGKTIKAVRNNAGGIVGKAEGDKSNKPILRDVYSGLETKDTLLVTARNNAGGMAGRLYDVEITNKESVKEAISLNIYTNNSKVTATYSNAGGIIGNADYRGAASTDTRYEALTYDSYYKNLETGAGLGGNTFIVGDVYNCGTISTGRSNAGGIIGVGGDGKYYNTRERVIQLVQKKMLTNTGNITAGTSNAGGVIGFANEKFEESEETINYEGKDIHVDVGDVFNSGKIQAQYNAGGIAGKAIGFDLKYTRDVLIEAIKAETGNPDNFLFTNTNTVKATNSNAGGVIGDAVRSVLQDTFNSGTSESYTVAVKEDGEPRIIAGYENAGGLVGRAKGLSVTYSKLIANQLTDPVKRHNFVYTNIANVRAGTPKSTGVLEVPGNNAGGILGYGRSSIQLVDVYNMGRVEAYRNEVNSDGDNAGGLIGLLEETGGDTVTDDSNEEELSGVSIEDNQVLKYGTDSGTSETTIELDKRVSYITYRTIVTDKDWDTNRYSNRPKEKTIKDGEYEDVENVIAGNNNAGGIVGQISATQDTKSVRIEDVFNSGAYNSYGDAIAGIRAKGSNAGGLIGSSTNGYISYSLDINPGPDNLKTKDKGDHSTFVQAFNDIEVRKDPYAINEVALHMVANNATVRASSVDAGVPQSTSEIYVGFENGRQNMSSENAGGAVGYMQGGRIERVYSLQGEVVSPRNVGGVVGNLVNAKVKQTSRLDGEDIHLGSKLRKLGGVTLQQLESRGSQNVGGIVGLASTDSEILDTRNYISVEGRTAVGGIVGRAGSRTKVTLAQNVEPITGTTLRSEDVYDLLGVDLKRDVALLDKSAVDGCYIGGIVGYGDNTIEVTMAKNDPLITNEFSDLQLDDVFKTKYTLGGNEETAIRGKAYVGGITGAYGIVNYSVNTGKVDGVKLLGGISGSGYRITNSFNTADVIGQNDYMYVLAAPVENRPEITDDQEATHIGGIAGELGKRLNENSIVQDKVDDGTYIQSVFNGAQIIRGASFVGGVAGLAVGPIDVAYNSAVVSSKQTGTVDGNQGIAGTQVGGLVGVMAQDRRGEIVLSNSYSVGEIVGTADRGTLVGLLEGYTQDLAKDPEGNVIKRIQNSYYLSDDQMNSWNSFTGQLSTELNYGLKPLGLTDESTNLDNFVYQTKAITGAGDPANIGDSDYKQDSEYGLRNYGNMIRNYRLAGSGTIGAAKGDQNLQKPLNEKIDTLEEVKIIKKTADNVEAQQKQSSAKYVYPYKDTSLTIGTDYEFPHLNFRGNENNDKGTEDQDMTVALGDYSSELPGNEQYFVSLDNTKVSYYHNYWPTKVVDQMKTDVIYSAGTSDDKSKYTKGHWEGDDDKSNIDITFRSNDKYPTQRVTDETITIKGTYTLESVNPDYIHYEVYDGHSRGRYDPTNQTFTNIVYPKSPVKVYTLAKQSLFDEYDIPDKFKPVEIRGENYYLYAKDTNNADGTGEYDTVDNLTVSVLENSGKIEVSILLPCLEMNSYLPAATGYFTVEASKVYDVASGITKETYDALDRTSRMFSMHFSNHNINQDHNNSVLDAYWDFDYDDLTNLEYDSDGTAALGGTLLKEISGSGGEGELIVANKLQIYNERHLYNMNHGETMGYAVIGSSNLKYLMRDIELMKNIQLSVNEDGYNGFIIGASNDKLYRMTGSLDGNGYTIGNIRVDRFKNPSRFRVDKNDESGLADNDYAFIYDLSGGVVKNLYIGDDSKIVANTGAGLAYYVSNGRFATDPDPYNDTENMLYENLGPQLPKETGTNASIYDTTVLAQINGYTVGGFSVHTARRFNSSSRVTSTSEDETLSAIYTDVTFGGKINGRYGSSDEFMSENGDDLVDSSRYAAGIQCFVSGIRRSDDIDENDPSISLRSNYKTIAEINGSQVSEEGYVFANDISAGILCLAQYGAASNVPQTGTIRKSVNNGEVVSKQQANGITQGIEEETNDSDRDQECRNKSHVNVTYSYNNGIVQTPEGSGLASGIGNFVSEASYCTNNGSVYGLIASGISNYGDNHTIVDLCVNNGYVQGGQIAGGIVATPSRYTGGKAKPYQDVQLKLSNSYNTGDVVVTTNIDNERAIENSYAGGILGYASSPDPKDYAWDTHDVADIEEEDMTIIDSCYNVGTVKYAKDYTKDAITTSGVFSDNNRNIGGIAGGGLNRYVDIQNCYSLSDAELEEKETVKPKKIDINSYYTDFTKHDAVISKPSDTTGYNYRLTAVGDVTYGNSVTVMNYIDMTIADNFVNFDDEVWVIDRDNLDDEGEVLYPFPQFKERETEPAYVGDELIADYPDFKFNIDFNKAKNDVDIETPIDRMNDSGVTHKELVASSISYKDSEYSIDINGYSATDTYQVTVYDGDAYQYKDYAAAIIRQYQITNGIVTSGGKLHDEVSTTEKEMEFFDKDDVNLVTLNGGKLTIHDAEELGWYMPNHGFYSVVVTKSTSDKPNPSWWARVGAFFRGDGTVHGNLKIIDVQGMTSDRFQVHFGGTESNGSNIVSRGLSNTYKYGTASNPYHITDQYSVIGMTTSGIAKNATDERYFKQVDDFVIDEPFYSMFEFNGDYDGNGHTITQENGDIGFISYLRSTDPDAMNDSSKFAARVHDLVLDVTALESETKMSKLGKYQEASNYTANMGLIADYMESAYISGVSTEGIVQPGLNGGNNAPFHRLADEKYYVDGTHTLAGIAAVAKKSTIEQTQNNAQMGVVTEEQTAKVSLGQDPEDPDEEPETMEVPYEDHRTLSIQVAGITALGIDTVFENVSNDGTIVASRTQHAAGLVHTIKGDSEITRSMNGGWVKAHDGVAAGITKTLSAGKIVQVYNSGKITARYNINNEDGSNVSSGWGTAVGLVASPGGGTFREAYNAGMIVGQYQGAISRYNSSRGTLENNLVYYLKDEALYWADSHTLPNLPDSMNVANEEEANTLELLMGFGIVPTEVWAFANDDGSEYIIPEDEDAGTPEGYDDPFAVTYAELTHAETMKDEKGFNMTVGSSTGVWEIDASPKNDTIDASNIMIRDYAKDPYPMPKFKDYDHETRENINFPLIFGEAEQIAETPYLNDDEKIKYEPYDFVVDAGETETFKDTIKVDLNEMKSTAKYQVLVYDGDPDKDDMVGDKVNTAVTINVVKKYLDLRQPQGIATVSDPENMQYSKIYSTGSGAYYYEVLALDSSGNGVPAIFKNKAFVDDTNEILFNNNVMDRWSEPSDINKPYYSASVINYRIPDNGSTDYDHYYSKFSPHFAEATETQAGTWTYGTETNKYEISTKRNLNNIAKGGQIPPGVTESHYLKSHYKQTQDIRLDDQKADVLTHLEGNHVDMWQDTIGTATIGFSGSYTGKSADDPGANYQMIENRSSTSANGITHSIFSWITKDAVVSDIEISLPTTAKYYQNPFLVKRSYGKISNIEVSRQGASATVYMTEDSPYGFIVGETIETPGVTSVPIVEKITIADDITFRDGVANIPAFGSVIGRVNGFAKIENIESAGNVNVSGNNITKAVGGIIGEIIPLEDATENSEIDLRDITYSGTITTDSYNVAQIVGGIVGNVEKTDLSLYRVSTKETIKISRTIADGGYGGFVGRISDGKIAVTDSQSAGAFKSATTGTGIVAGGVIGKAVNVPSINLTNVSSGTGTSMIDVHGTTGEVAVGGIIGDAAISGDTGNMKLDGVVNDSSLNISGTSGQNIAGGLIGNSEGYVLSITNSQSIRDIKNAGTTGATYVGGIIGKSKGAPNITITDVQVGEVGDVDADIAEVIPTINGSSSSGGLTVGGIIGDAETAEADSKIELDQVVNNGIITAATTTGAGIAGGLIGNSKGYELFITNSQSLRNITRSQSSNAATAAYVGGIVGKSEDAPNITITEVKVGEVDDVDEGTAAVIPAIKGDANTGSITIGGIIGHASTSKADGEIKLDKVTNNGDIGYTTRTVTTGSGIIGGMIGNSKGYELSVTDSASLRNISYYQSSSTASQSTHVGGVIGKSEGAPNITIKDMVNVGADDTDTSIVVTAQRGTMAVGGIIGEAVPSSSAGYITIDHVNNYSSITAAMAYGKSNVGGMIGYSENYELFIRNSGALKGISSKQTTSNTTVENYTGGIIGRSVNAPNIELKTVEAGTMSEDLVPISLTNIEASALPGNLYVGGIIGKAITALDTGVITMDGVSNNSNITGSVTTGLSMTGGIIGHSDGYELSINNTNSFGSITQTTNGAAAKANVGGIIGQVENTADVSLTEVTAGSLNEDGDAAITSIIVNDPNNTGSAGEMNIGGIIGNAVGTYDVDDPEMLALDEVNSNHNITVINYNGKNVTGGVIGRSQGYQLALNTVEASGSIKQTVTNNQAMSFVGGIIGQVQDAPDVKLIGVTNGLFDDEEGESLTTIEVIGNGDSRVFTGGIIGQADHVYDDVLSITTEGVMNDSDIVVEDPATASAVGGIIAQQGKYQVSMENTINRGNIKIKEFGDENRLYVGGFVGKSVKGKLDINDTPDSDVVNYGDIEVDVRVQNPDATVFTAGTLFAAGGVAFVENCETTINGFRNVGNIDVTGENQDLNIYMAGALAYATSEETIGEGISRFALPEAEIKVYRTLNEGNLSDNRKELDEEEQEDRTRTEGIAKAAGLVAETSVEKGTDIEYNQNTGNMTAATAAGIIHTVDGEENIAKSSVMYNINQGFMDVKDDMINGDNITMTAELPVGEAIDEDSGTIIYNGLGEVVNEDIDDEEEDDEDEEDEEDDEDEEDEEDAEGEEDEGEDEEEEEWIEPVLDVYYNLSIEDAIRPDNLDKEESEESEELEGQRLLGSARAYTLAELQHFGSIMAASGWTSDQLSEAVGGANDDSPWIIHSEDPAADPDEDLPFLLPTIRGNEAAPRDDKAYLAKAVYAAAIERNESGDGYEVRWKYDDEIDELQDGFAIIIDSEQGEVRKIIELGPGVAEYDDDTEEYYYDVNEKQIANVTNNLEDDELHEVRVASMRGESNRRMSSFSTDTMLEQTTGIEEESDSIVVRVGGYAGIMPGSFYLAYDGTIGNAVVAYAYTRLGDPYSMPLAGQGSYVDCSYLALSAYRSVGINLPRTAAAQAQYMVENGYTISKAELQPGDLVFYSWGYNGRFMNIGHVSIYIGNNQIIEASSTQGKVVVSPLTADNCQVLYGRPYTASPSIARTGVQGTGNGIAVPAANAEEIYLVAQIVGLEAGGEGDAGMIAVAEVIKNRVISNRFAANTYTEVVSAPGQFSTYAMRNRYVPSQHQIELVKGVMEGKIGVLNNTNVLYFCAGWYYQQTGINGFWGNMTLVADYGNYFFAP